VGHRRCLRNPQCLCPLPAADDAIVTDLNPAQNNVNVVASDIVVSCGIGVGTASEVALALNSNKQVVLVHAGQDAVRFFTGLRPSLAHPACSPSEAIGLIHKFRAGAL